LPGALDMLGGFLPPVDAQSVKVAEHFGQLVSVAFQGPGKVGGGPGHFLSPRGAEADNPQAKAQRQGISPP